MKDFRGGIYFMEQNGSSIKFGTEVQNTEQKYFGLPYVHSCGLSDLCVLLTIT